MPVERVVLFGSRARGDAERDSDVDVLVVIRRETPELRRLFFDAAFEVSMDRGCWLVPATYPVDDWDQVREVFRLYGWNRVRDVVLRDFRGLRELPEPTLRLWMLVFAPEEWRREEEENWRLSERELVRKK